MGSEHQGYGGQADRLEIGSILSAATLPASAYLGAEGKIRSDMNDQPPAARRASPWADVLFSTLAQGAAWLTLALLAGILI